MTNEAKQEYLHFDLQTVHGLYFRSRKERYEASASTTYTISKIPRTFGLKSKKVVMEAAFDGEGAHAFMMQMEMFPGIH